MDLISFLDLHKVNQRFEAAFLEKTQEVISRGRFVLGEELMQFEHDFAAYCQLPFCVGVGNGLDALVLIFKGYMELGMLQPGDEVIVPANTYIASIMAVIHSGLNPVLVEPDLDTFNLSLASVQEAYTSKTKAVLMVHMYGQISEATALVDFCNAAGILLVENAAQAAGASYKGKKAGNIGHAAAFSFYPGKNLGALGDGGAVTTHNEELATAIRALRNYGSEMKYQNRSLGFNSKLDELQAGYLNLKLPFLDQDNQRRNQIAYSYLSEIKNHKLILPRVADRLAHVFHLFVVRVAHRNDFQSHMLQHNIQTLIHYPIAPHQQKALRQFKDLNLAVTQLIHQEVVSLPLNPVLSDAEVAAIIAAVNAY